uniref:Chromo domain-containing protein n=1 Tax=Bursaphelenchus xylophilus TaxID=6326 RepID=A0A1I7SCM3_BURXY
MQNELSGRLSSFEDSEDDCDLRATSKTETYVISYVDEEVLNLTPWYEIDRTSQVLPTERKQTQTMPTHGVLLEKASETSGYECESKETYCEVKYDHKDGKFEQSAYTRVMKVLSIMANHENLINWFSVDNPEGAEVLKITPHAKNVEKIIDSTYLKDK